MGNEDKILVGFADVWKLASTLIMSGLCCGVVCCTLMTHTHTQAKEKGGKEGKEKEL